jgi:flagellar biosynthetic protein FliR
MIISIAQTQMFILALTRILAILIQVPVLGGTLVPLQVKAGLGLILAAIMVPWQLQPASAPVLPVLGLGMAIGRELIIGLLAGFAATLTFNVLQIAGEMMALSSGFGSGRIMNPTLGESGTALDQMYVMFGMLIFLLINGHHAVILAVQKTFEVLPINHPLPAFTGEVVMSMTAQLILLGIQIALPVAGALLLTDITLGLLARVAPQIQVFFLGLPIKIALATFAVGLIFSISLPTITELFNSLGPRMLKLLGG